MKGGKKRERMPSSGGDRNSTANYIHFIAISSPQTLMEKEREGSSSSETNPPEEERDESMVNSI